MATKILNPATKHSPVAITAKQPVSHNGVVVQPGEVLHVSEKVATKLLASGDSWGAVEKDSPAAAAPPAAPLADAAAKKPAA
jgi:hypothetical protein